MFKKAHSTSTIARNGTLSTPYASRSSMARSSTDYPGSMHRSMVNSRRSYYSLSDPHLTHFFQKKLLAGLDRERSRSSLSVSRPQSSQSTPRRPHTAHSQVQVCYKVNIRTGSSADAGTAARTYISLEGGKGVIRRQRLTRGGRREFVFNAGSLERFKVRGKDIGEVTKIKLENEALKSSNAWFVESVSVTNEEGKKWVCPCNQWLSLHHSDCQLSRTLKAKPFRPNQKSNEDQHLTNYTIHVHTGNVRGAGTGANVFITLVGTKGLSCKSLLKSEDSFDRGSVARSQLECADIGRLKSLEIEHDNSGFGPDWFLDRVVVYKSSEPDKKVYFHCGQWLSRTEGDGSIQRTLHASSTPPKGSVGKTYLVVTQTGNLRGAGTDANVYVTLYGSLGSSGEKRLDNDPANFERGRKDTFSIQCCDLGELTKVKVRHDNTGSGPSWMLESVGVRCEGGDGVRVFPCGQWLEVCDGCGGKLEVELIIGEQEERKKKSDEVTYHYTIQTVTDSRPGAGTNANAYIILHHRDAHSDKIWLDNGQRTFLPGQTDRFDVTTSRLYSPIESVTVGHDNSGPGPGWFLEQVSVTCHSSGTTLVFPCGHWMCMDSGDGRIERELHPLVSEDNEEGRGGGKGGRGSKHKWTIHVWTSDIRGAGTDANVTLQVHGSYGNSSVIPLGDNIANFEQGEHDTFAGVTLPRDIGDIDHVTISHDNTNPYPDWHLDKVVLSNEVTGEEYLAECGRWLSTDKGDRSTTVKLKAVQTQAPSSHPPPPSLDPTSSSSQQHNGGDRDPERVEQYHSDDGTSISELDGGETTLQNSTPIEPEGEQEMEGGGDNGDDDSYGSDQFESGGSGLSLSDDDDHDGVDDHDGGGRGSLGGGRGSFGEDLGRTRRHNMSSELDSSITNKYLQQLKYAAQMSANDSSGLALSATASPARTVNGTVIKDDTLSPKRNTIPYTIHVAAGSPPATSPAPFLIVTMIGERGSSPPIQLEPVGSCHGYSAHGKVETFSVEGAMVGNLTAIKVLLKCPKSGVSWLIDEISIHSPTSGHTHHFPWGRGIQPGREYVIERVEQLLGSSINTSTRGSSPMVASGLAAYQVKVSTADKKQAGTNNNLHLILVGEQSASKPFTVKNSIKHLKLQRGQTDTFQIATPTIGPLKAVKVAHCPRRSHTKVKGSSAVIGDGEDSSKWYLFQLVLTRLSDHKKHYFLCRKWIMASQSPDQLNYTVLPLTKVE